MMMSEKKPVSMAWGSGDTYVEWHTSRCVDYPFSITEEHSVEMSEDEAEQLIANLSAALRTYREVIAEEGEV